MTVKREAQKYQLLQDFSFVSMDSLTIVLHSLPLEDFLFSLAKILPHQGNQLSCK